MATTLRAFLTLLKDNNNSHSSEEVEEGDHSSSRGANSTAEGSSIPLTRSLVYKMYKRVVFHTIVDETSSEMTLDCSSFSEHDYYDLEDYDDFGGDYFKEGSSVDDHIMPLSSPAAVIVRAPPESSSVSLPSSSSPSSSSVETPHLLYDDTPHQDWKNSFADTDNDAFLLRELADRASLLLQRESCSDYMIKNYFQRLPGCCPRFPPSGQTAAAAAPAAVSSDSSSPSESSLPIDSKCRSIMMNWSFRVVEFALLNLEGRQRQQMKAWLLSRTFSYVDRICTKFDIVNRDQYKLLTIVCLHLAAKISGLLKSNEQVYDDCNERCQQRCSDETTTSTSGSTSSSSSTPSTSSSEVMSVEESQKLLQQTIVPTPYSHSQGSIADDSSLPRQEEDQLQDQTNSEQTHSTEYIWLLSLHGLHSLSHDEFTLDEFKQMECTILHHGLDWRLSSVVALDWVDIYLEVMVLCPPPLLLRCSIDSMNNDTSEKKNFLSFTNAECDDIRDATLTQLEYALKRPCFLTYAPCLLGLAAFLNVMKGYCGIGSNDSDLVLLSSIEGAIGLSIDYDELYDLQVKMMFQHDDDECMV
mmetsp:Transcript_12875/g.19853  ORF Transcript_12875/g.19853 Transcript_12875/m.19853 type:complete len:583 (-) Transcript_12875:48-1796(-)